MARDPLAYKYTGQSNPDGTAAEFIMGVPSRDIHRSEFDGMTDAEKAALGASHLHRAYGKADEEADAAAERIGQDDAAPIAVAADPIPATEAQPAGAVESAPRGKR